MSYPIANPDDERRKRLLAQMAGSIQQTQSPQAVKAGITTPSPVTALPPATATMPTDAPPVGPTSPIAQQPMPAIRVGYSTAGLTGLDKLMQRKQAMESADPESKVTNPTGDFEEVGPPSQGHGWKSRLKAAGMGALRGLANSDPNSGASGIGGAIGGALFGGISPRGEAKIERRIQIRQADNDIERGLKLQQQQAQVGNINAERKLHELEPAMRAAKAQQDVEIANAHLEIERQKAAGLITQHEAERQQHELDRQSREKIAADNVISREKVAGMKDGGVDKVTENQSNRDAALTAASDAERAANDHLGKRKTADEQISGLRQQLTAMGAVSPDDPQRIGLEDEIKRLEGESHYRQTEADKAFSERDKYKREAGKFPVAASNVSRGTSTAPSAPTGVTEASIRAEGRQRKQSAAAINAAIKKAHDLGWIK